MLSEQFGAASLVGQGEFISVLAAHGKPVELFFYPDAPHSLSGPCIVFIP